MSKCTCLHDRLLHDMWGCKVCRSGCGVSVVYLTRNLFAKLVDRTKDQEDLQLAAAIDKEEDRKDEGRLKLLLQRASRDRSVQITTE